MTGPAEPQWWDDLIRADTVTLNDIVQLLWGDRVRVLRQDNTTKPARIFTGGSCGWVP